MKRNRFIDIALFFLVVHLFVVNSKLLFHLNADAVIGNTEVFDFDKIGVENIISMIISISYSIITAVVIKVICLPIKKIWNFAFIFWFALIDGCAVWLYYTVLNDYRIYASIFYGVYTLSIISAIGLNQIFEPKSIEVLSELELELPIIQ
jgi:hypothetical protein